MAERKVPELGLDGAVYRRQGNRSRLARIRIMRHVDLSSVLLTILMVLFSMWASCSWLAFVALCCAVLER
eukprot:5650190-Amphidinium_carterae.1